MKQIFIINRSLHSDADTLIRAMDSKPDSNRKRRINDFIKGCEADGNWNELDVLWFWAAHQQQAARLNWKTPGTYTATEVNSPTWTADRGFTGNGTSSYLSTGWIPSSHAVKYTLNNASAGFYSLTDNTSNTIDFGAADASNQSVTINVAPSGVKKVNGRLNSAVAIGTVTHSSTKGLYYLKRVDSSNLTMGKNGADSESIAVASAGLPIYEVYALAFNNSGTAASFCDRQQAFFFAGSANINQAKLHERVKEYLTELGAAV